MTTAAGSEITSDELMTVAASRALRDGAVCFVGIGLPSTGANLARRTHAPNLVLVYESGTIGAKPSYAQGYYQRDNEAYRAWDEISREPDRFGQWLEEEIYAEEGSRV